MEEASNPKVVTAKAEQGMLLKNVYRMKELEESTFSETCAIAERIIADGNASLQAVKDAKTELKDQFERCQQSHRELFLVVADDEVQQMTERYEEAALRVHRNEPQDWKGN